MLQQVEAEDFVIATGETYPLEKFVAEAFAHFNLNWKDHVKQNKAFMRPTDLLVSVGDATKAREKLGWTAKSRMADVVRLMVSEG